MLSSDWGPFYSKYFQFFSQFFSKPVELYYAARLVLCFFLLPVGIFLLVRLLTQNGRFAALAAVIIPLLDALARSDPGIAIFNLVVWIYVIYFFLWTRKIQFRFPGATFSLTLAFGAIFALSLFIRQDNGAYIAACACAGLLEARRRKTSATAILIHSCLGIVAFVVALELCTYFFRGSPFGSIRPLHAFADHFYWSRRYLFPDQPGLDRTSAVLAYFHYPKSLAALLKDNFLQLVPYFCSKTLLFLRYIFSSWGLCVLIGAAALTIPLQHRKRVAVFDAGLLPLLGMSFFKCAATCILLSTRTSYLVDFYVCLVAFLGWHIYTNLNFRAARIAIVPVLAFFLISSSTVVATIYGELRGEHSKQPQTAKTYIAELEKSVREKIGEQMPIPAVFSTGLVTAFLSMNTKDANIFDYQMYTVANDDSSLAQFLEMRNIDVVIVNEELRGVAKEVGVQIQLLEFEQYYFKLGFERIAALQWGTSTYVRTRKGLSQRSKIVFPKGLNADRPPKP